MKNNTTANGKQKGSTAHLLISHQPQLQRDIGIAEEVKEVS
jgi:hypothetical protein